MSGRVSHLSSKGLPPYSELGFGESLSKLCRHELCILVLEEIRLELSREPIPNKSRGRGRPKSPIGVLAQRMSVHNDSVRRWANIQEVQASDFNSEKLAIMAFKYSPEKVAKILMEDLDRRRMAMERWLKEADSKYRASPYAENIDVEEGV